MAKKIEESNGAWYVTETLPLESIIKNLSDNPTFKLETVDSKPKISFNLQIPQNSNLETMGYNEYHMIHVVSQLSSNSTYWGTRIWVMSDSFDVALNELAIAVVESQNPDVYRINHFNEIVDIVKIAKYYGGLAALEKKYGTVYKDKLDSEYELKSISRANDPNKSAPVILVKGTFAEKVFITISADIFTGTVEISYRLKDRRESEEAIVPLPGLWAEKRSALLGSNSDPNSVANSLRIAMFLDDNKAWSSPELLGDLLETLDIKTCNRLKNVV